MKYLKQSLLAINKSLIVISHEKLYDFSSNRKQALKVRSTIVLLFYELLYRLNAFSD